MVNYDLPWNPNRIEQRFGRIHRIGQTEVCHLWNLVAAQDPRGRRLRAPAREARRARRRPSAGSVFDVLGRADLRGQAAPRLLIEAIRYGDTPEVRTQMTRVIDEALDVEHLARAARRPCPRARTSSTRRKVAAVRDELERAEASRLQPHYVRELLPRRRSSASAAQVREREPGRYELTQVPGRIRDRAREAGDAPGVLGALRADRVREGPGRGRRAARSPSSSARATRSSRRRSTSSSRTIATSSAAVRC